MTQAVLSALGGRVALRVPVRAAVVSAVLLLMIVAVLAWSLMVGSYPMGISDVIHTLSGNPPSKTAAVVVWEFRFPRTVVAFLAGGFMALSGATLQYVTRNPLADPSLIGVSQGAALVVVAVTILKPELGLFWRPILAFAGALGVAALVQAMSTSAKGGETLRFVLTGVGVAALISSCTSVLLIYGDINRAHSALGWLAGSIHATGWDEVRWLTLAALILVPPLFAAARALSALRFGQELATGLGIQVRPARATLVVLAVGLAATAVAAVGPLGFVGLVAPHLARRLAEAGVGFHLVLTALTGALIVGLADFAGRAVFAPTQIPAGLVTAVIGVPVFVLLILRSQARNHL